jgi:hypothetical protein
MKRTAVAKALLASKDFICNACMKAPNSVWICDECGCSLKGVRDMANTARHVRGCEVAMIIDRIDTALRELDS